LRLLQFAAALFRALTLNRQWHDQAEMSDTGLTVPGMTGPPRRYDVTITVDQDGGHRPNPNGRSIERAGQAAQMRPRMMGSRRNE
jgi:hypothetical protein